MKTGPITPARIAFGDVPEAPDFGDLYHPRIGAAAQAEHVFLQGNGLPQRWQGRPRFTVLETGFGLGNNFLATWDAWRRDPSRSERLHFVSVERHPPAPADLRRAHGASPWPALAAALQQAWPPLTANLHALDFDGGRVRLLLAFGDVAAVLPSLRASVDAFFLDGFAPARNPEMWQPRVVKALARLAAPGATLATWSVARGLREALTASGFEVERAPGIGGKREITVARFAPRFATRALPEAARPAARHAVVVGAGAAGACAAQALAAAGLEVTVLERREAAASETSGNPGGIFHGTVNADDGPYARLYRAGALHAARAAASACAAGIPGEVNGLLRLQPGAAGLVGLQTLQARLGLPQEYVQALDADSASARAGVPLAAPAWFFPGGGWISPGGLSRHLLAAPGVRLVTGVEVAALARQGEAWRLADTQGRTLAEADIVVLACAAQAARLCPQPPAWPLRHTRGQVTHWSGAHALRLPLAGDGYAVPLPGGLLCGATREAGEPGDVSLREADHRYNVERLQRLCGLAAPPDAGLWQGRTGYRLHTDDRQPIAGALPAPGQPARADQGRLLPREGGLFVLTALGARGLTLAPLLAEFVAAQATGTPWPLEQDLADAVDPARWQVRAARRAGDQAPG